VNSPSHALVGAVAGVLPDCALFLYGWRRRWLPPTHPLVRLHRFLHSPAGLIVAAALGWASHLLLDRYSTHRVRP
jgi:hypothetical protein